MKVSQLFFVPGGMPQFWRGQEERRSRLTASKGSTTDNSPAVEMELMVNMGGYVKLTYEGRGPYFIGPHMISGIVPTDITADLPTKPETPAAKK